MEISTYYFFFFCLLYIHAYFLTFYVSSKSEGFQNVSEVFKKSIVSETSPKIANQTSKVAKYDRKSRKIDVFS